MSGERPRSICRPRRRASCTLALVLLQCCSAESCDDSSLDYQCVSGSCRETGDEIRIHNASLGECISECNMRKCKFLQHGCGTSCVLSDSCEPQQHMLRPSCRIYHKDWGRSTAGGDWGKCFPGGPMSGLFACTPASYCSNQVRASKLGSMSLDMCMEECQRRGCSSIQYDCNTRCWLFDSHADCGTETTSICGSSLYHRVTTTTSAPVENNCFPQDVSTGFDCLSRSYCSNQADAVKLGVMDLAQCLSRCVNDHDCQAVQYDCNERCWLLESCVHPLETLCGSSVYLKGTTSTTTLGSCWQNSVTSLSDFRCLPGKFCETIGGTTNYGPMTLDHCAALCRATACAYIQYQCNQDCHLLHGSQECVERPTACGTVIYERRGSEPAGPQAHGPGQTVIYQTLCSDCGSVGAHLSCPEGWPLSCDVVPRTTPNYLHVDGNGCDVTVYPSHPGPVVAELVCSSLQSTMTGSCDGLTLGCYCYGLQAECRQPAESRLGVPRCKSWQRSLCWPGAENYVLRNLEDITFANQLNWCGWASVRDQAQADCRAFLQEPSDEVGGCRSSECLDLMDCVRICEACSSCTGIQYVQAAHGPEEDPKGMRCYMQNAAVRLGSTRRSPEGHVFYVNSRHPECPQDHGIRGLRFFQDSECSELLLPSHGTWPSLTNLWSPDEARACHSCRNVSVEVQFAQRQAVLCVVVVGSMSSAWELLNEGKAYAQGAPVIYDSDTSDISSARAVGLASFTGRLVVAGWEVQALAPALADVLLLPLHSVRLSGELGELELLVKFESVRGLHKSVDATLRAMREDLASLNLYLTSSGYSISVVSLSDLTMSMEPFTDPLQPRSQNYAIREVARQGQDLEMTGVTVAVVAVVCVTVMAVLWRWLQMYTAKKHVVLLDAAIVGRITLTDTKNLGELTPTAMMSVPKYWKSEIESPLRLGFEDLAYVRRDDLAKFQELVSDTYQGIPTQDRCCPTGLHGKTRGGCPCVQVGGSPGLPTGFQVKRVIRVEDSDMFNRYIARREKIKELRNCERVRPQFLTHHVLMHMPGMEEVVSHLDLDVNEAYLWHGTQVRTGLRIAQEDFNLAMAGLGAGTMYGKGLYFSESSTKADEYSRDEPAGYYQGIRALLLCRVTLGQFYYTLDRESSAIDRYLQGFSDSTLGDRARAVGTYREFVVYDTDQVYPEYLVLYERLHGLQRPEPPPKDLPFLLELPLYWKNVGKDPRMQEFREHWMVKPKVQDLIHRLAQHSSAKSCPKVQRAKRVEDSVMWCKYTNWKKHLTEELQNQGRDHFTPPNELDGNAESGHVLTAEILACNDGDEAIGLENLAPGLNEMLLWHGTSRESAAAIASDGFLLGAMQHGRRFGHGVYLAEDLRKSLSYSTESDGVKYVLLCRAVCGEMYYTEHDRDPDAHERAKEMGMQSVLANPAKVGPREYILFDTDQVYPEYIVEFTLRDTE